MNKPEFWSKAKAFAGELHAYDPDIIFQGCLFEIVTEEVNQVKIPDWVFKGYGLPVESHNFSYVDMLNKEGLLVDHWRKAVVYRILVDRKLSFGSIILLVLTSMSVARLFILGRSS